MLKIFAYRKIFLALNALRVLSLIGLTLLFASSVFVLVNDVEAYNAFSAGKRLGDNSDLSNSMLDCDYIMGSTVPNEPWGIFWAVLNRLLIIFQVIALILSEFCWPAVFFHRFFPVLGATFGLGALGCIQCLIGASVLSHHVDRFAMVSAFFLFSIGWLNIAAGLIWREKAKTLRALKSADSKEEVLPSYNHGGLKPLMTGNSTLHAHFEGSEKGGEAHAGLGFGRQAQKNAANNGFMVTKPAEALPAHMPRPTSQAPLEPQHTSTSSNTAV